MKIDWSPKCNVSMKAVRNPLVKMITVNSWIPLLRLAKRFLSDIVLKGSRYHPCMHGMGNFTENKGAGIVVHLADEHLIYEKVSSLLTFVLLLFANF